MKEADIVKKSAAYVSLLMAERLPDEFYFHNIHHTNMVVNAVSEIANHSKLTGQGLTILKIATWFHDTGYLYHYQGHEDSSMIIASTFLVQQYADDIFIQSVLNCIKATKLPQSPQNRFEKIICDADLFHFSLTNYQDLALSLKKEQEFYLGRTYTLSEWNELNLKLLKEHKYFTGYGQTVLQKRKQENIEKLEKAEL